MARVAIVFARATAMGRIIGRKRANRKTARIPITNNDSKNANMILRPL
jgi:hypothetical protein